MAGAPLGAGQSRGALAGLSPGARIAEYVIEEQVGAGGMAVVYRARDEILGRLAAVKVMAATMAADEEFRARFLRESRAVASIDNPHIIPVYGAGEAAGTLYLATRFVAGGDLGRALRRDGGAAAPDRVSSLITQVAAALDAAHAAGVVHRDVKPGNILLDVAVSGDEHAYLSDFGLCRRSAFTTDLTVSGQFMGTPGYCAPEQIRGQPVDGRTDQYALACVAYELLCGAPPFARAELVATLYAQLNDPVPAASAARPGVPAAVDRVLERALAKNPVLRYRTCGDLASALRDALSPAIVIPRTPTVPTPRPTPGEARRSRRTALALGTVVVTAAAAGTIIHLAPWASSPPPKPVAVFAVPSNDDVERSFLSNDGKFIVGLGRGSESADVSVWDIAHHRLKSMLAPFGDTGAAAALSPDDSILTFLASYASTVAAPKGSTMPSVPADAVYRLPLTKAKPTPAFYVPDDASCLVSGNGAILVGTVSGGIDVWDFRTGKWTTQLTGPDAAGSKSIDDDGDIVAVAGSRHVFVWNVRLRRVISTLPYQPGKNSFAGISPDGKIVQVRASSGALTLWDVATQKNITPHDPRWTNSGAVFSADGQVVATQRADGTVDIWQVRTRRHLSNIRVTGTLQDAGPQGRVVLTEGWDSQTNKLYLWAAL